MHLSLRNSISQDNGQTTIERTRERGEANLVQRSMVQRKGGTEYGLLVVPCTVRSEDGCGKHRECKGLKPYS